MCSNNETNNNELNINSEKQEKHKEYYRKWKIDNRDHVNSYMREFYDKKKNNPEWLAQKKIQRNAYMKEYRERLKQQKQNQQPEQTEIV
jgi:hypothetical protein